MIDTELKKKVESVLFSAGKAMELKEIAKVCGTRKLDKVRACLDSLQQEYDEQDTSLKILDEGDNWKFTVRDRYLDVVSKIVTQTELSKSLMETLAVIAYKAPMLQSELIKIRTNKAYDHLRELEELGYITRSKQGRTKLIRLAPRFFEYFDIPPEALKARFTTVAELEKAVEEKEQEVKEMERKNKEQYKADKHKDQERKKQLAQEHQKVDKELARLEEKHIDLIDEETGKEEALEEYSASGEHPEELSSEIKVFEETADKPQEKTQEGEGSQEEGEGSGEMPEEDTEEPEEEEPQEDKGEAEDEEDKDTEPEEQEEEEAPSQTEPPETQDSEETADKQEDQEPQKEKHEEPADKQEAAQEQPEQETQEGGAPDKDGDENGEAEETKNEEDASLEQETQEEKERVTEEGLAEEAAKAAEKAKGPDYKSKGLFGGKVPEALKDKVEARVAEITGQKPPKKEKKKTE